MSNTARYTAFRYMVGFECTGGACEDTCCSGWSIVVDAAHYASLKQAMSASPAEREEFRSKYRLVQGLNRSPAKHALAVLQPTGDCSYLADDRSCTVHARYGEEQLSDTCAIFPRSVGQVGARFEVAGTTSCPEVARRLLTASDAMDVVDADPHLAPRKNVQRLIGHKTPTAYERHHDAIRMFVCDLLSIPNVPVDTRLFFVSYFANRTTSFLTRDTRMLDDAAFARTVQALDDQGLRTALSDEFGRLKVPSEGAAALVLELIALRAEKVGAFRALAESAVHRYLSRAAALPNADDPALAAIGVTTPVETAALLRGYQAVRRDLEQDFGAELDLAVTNYAKNYWVKEWYTTSPNLLVHAQNLLLRVAIFRFLVFGHPALAGVEGAPKATRKAAFDRAMIDAVQKFSRHFEHNPTFLRAIEARLGEKGLQTLAYSVVLLRT